MQALNLDHMAATGSDQYKVFSYFSDRTYHVQVCIFLQTFSFRIIKIFLRNRVTLSNAILIQIGDRFLFLDGQVMIQTKAAHQAGTL
jgi:hypothetical protein